MLVPTSKQSQRLHTIADACARLWNEINYRRRQSFFAGAIDWEWRELYKRYKGIFGSATAQQIERKNQETWKSFFALLRLKKEKRLPEHIKRVSPPGYWKNRRTNTRKLIILIRRDLYHIKENELWLPKKLHVKWVGKPNWTNWSKQGLLTIAYDAVKGRWYARQPVEVKPPHQPLSNRRAFIDLGIINLLSIAVEGEQQSIVYSGRPALSDWWYISKKIQRLKSIARTVNKRESTIQIRRLHRKRRCRYHQYVNTIVRRAVEYVWYRGVSKLVVGDLRGILANVHGRRKTNTMTHNFWSHQYVIQRVREVAEEFNITIELIDERGTSSTCPRCGSNQITRRGRLFKCQGCKLEANRDGVGAVNIGLAHGAVFPGEVINGAVACPLEVRI